MERLPRDALLADGSPCELAKREVLRLALEGIRELGYETRAAFEYEMRIWDAGGRPLSTGISYSIVEAVRYHELVSALTPPSTPWESSSLRSTLRPALASLS